MKLNPDCLRDVLLTMEETEFLESLSQSDLYSSLLKYSHDEIDYSVLKLDEAGFVHADIQKYLDGSIRIELMDITYDGHQFLANIRSNSIWNNVKEVSKKVGSSSIQAITQIATSIITEIIRSQLGLP